MGVRGLNVYTIGIGMTIKGKKAARAEPRVRSVLALNDSGGVIRIVLLYNRYGYVSRDQIWADTVNFTRT